METRQPMIIALTIIDERMRACVLTLGTVSVLAAFQLAQTIESLFKEAVSGGTRKPGSFHRP